MRSENKKIVLRGDEALEMLNTLSMIIVSLDHMASYYGATNNTQGLENEIAKFVIDRQVGPELAKIRSLLSEKFDFTLGDDELDDLERAAQDIKYWSPQD